MILAVDIMLFTLNVITVNLEEPANLKYGKERLLAKNVKNPN